MRALLFHAEEYGVSFHSFSNRPKEIFKEDIDGKREQRCGHCITAFITVEKGDSEEKTVKGVVEEIKKMCK